MPKKFKEVAARVGWRKLNRDVQEVGGDRRDATEAARAEAEDEELLQEELAIVGASGLKGLPLPEMVAKFRQERLYAE